VTFDDAESLRVKSRYIVEHGLAGAMFWEYYADPSGTLLGTLPAHVIFAYCADALFNGTMTQSDAMKRLAIVAALLIALVLLPTLLKKRIRNQSPEH